jgi:hypothetical protein
LPSELEIRPFEGFGPIDFGMKKSELIALFGAPAREFEGGRVHFSDPAVFVVFDSNDACQFVEAIYS